MKTFIRSFVILLGVTLLTGCSGMKSVSKALGHKDVYTELFIEAEPEEIWAVITDAEGYAGWNNVIVQAKGEYAQDAKIMNWVAEPGKKPAKISSKVEIYDEPYHLNQFGGYLGVITFDHHYILEKVEGGTKVIQRENYTGFYTHFWDHTWLNEGYATVNRNLRDEVLRRRVD